jgi:hypothetical protein
MNFIVVRAADGHPNGGSLILVADLVKELLSLPNSGPSANWFCTIKLVLGLGIVITVTSSMQPKSSQFLT